MKVSGAQVAHFVFLASHRCCMVELVDRKGAIMKKIKLDRWFLAGIALGCGWVFLVFLLKLPQSNWFVFAATLIVTLLMALLFKQSDKKK